MKITSSKNTTTPVPSPIHRNALPEWSVAKPERVESFRLLGLAKVFDKLEYAEMAQRGTLRMMPLNSYVSQSCDAVRKDKNDSLVGYYAGETGRLSVALEGSNCFLPIPGAENIRLQGPSSLRAYCFHMFTAEQELNEAIESRDFDRAARMLQPHPLMRDFGPWVLHIHDLAIFKARVDVAVSSLGVEFARLAPIQYIDISTLRGALPPHQQCFVKDSCYEHEREMRLLIDAPELDDDQPLWLELGDLSDCSRITTIDEMMEPLRVV